MKKLIALFMIIIAFLPLIKGEEIAFTEYNKNPVFDPLLQPGEEIFPCVLYDANKFSGHGTSYQYKMWYGDTGGPNGTLKTAYSLDGINWSEQAISGLSSAASHPVVVYDVNGFGEDIYYKMWYWDSIGTISSIAAIRYAESTDGVTWINDQPIQQHAIDPSLQIIAGIGQYNNYFYHLYGPAYVIYNPLGTNAGSGTPDNKNDDVVFTYKYVMYYDSSSEGTSPSQTNEDTSLAYSSNGIYWIRHGDKPVLISSGNSNDWDGKYAFGASVVKVGNVYHLWYTGANGLGPDFYAQGIGHATSTDGINWVKDTNNPVFNAADGIPWRSARTYSQWVVFEPNGFGSGKCPNIKMWFSGKSSSTDAIEKVGYSHGCIISRNKNSLPLKKFIKILKLDLNDGQATGEIIKEGNASENT